MSNYQRTADWLKACGKEPSPLNLSLQFGCHLEEFCELLLSVGFTALTEKEDELPNLVHLVAAHATLEQIATALKKGRMAVVMDKPEATLDALCDMEVTGNGVAYFAGFNKPAADEAVLRANDAKLVEGKPVILPGGKIGKPEGWVAPDLSAFV